VDVWTCVLDAGPPLAVGAACADAVSDDARDARLVPTVSVVPAHGIPHAVRNSGRARRAPSALGRTDGLSTRLEQAKASRGTEGVLEEPAPDVLLMDFAPSSIGLRVRWWIAPPKRADALDVRDKVLTAAKNQLTSHGIDLPFPRQQVLSHDQTEDRDGDRARQREGWPAGSTDVPASRKVADAVRHLSGSKPPGVGGE
jgi:small-conductance mechanosensitive channel